MGDSLRTPDGELVHLLLVDDDAIDVMHVRREFRKAALLNPVREAANGVEALALLREVSLPYPRTVVLLDLSMPKMSGTEFLKELRADPALESTLVVVLTSSNEDRDRLDAARFDVAGYLLKPIEVSRFSALVSLLLENPAEAEAEPRCPGDAVAAIVGPAARAQ